VRRAVLLLLAALSGSIVLAGCSGGGGSQDTSGSAATVQRSCPAAWRAGWQRLANDVGAPVYCPTWMPREIDGQIGGRFKNGRWVDKKDRSYLVSFLWADHDAGVSREVHVNFRGYPGRTAIPMCESTHTVKGKTVRKPVACFADPRGTKRIGDVTATLYSVNQGIDEWHALYAWRRDGSLYTVSEHVVAPYSYKQVIRNLDRMTRGLVLLEPST
jgi:hypothetical protein